MSPVNPADPERARSVASSAVSAGRGPNYRPKSDVSREPECPSAAHRADTYADVGPGAPLASSLLVELLAHLRETVVTFVQRRRGEGAPVERVLPEVKVIVGEAAAGEGMRELAQPLVAHAVRWCIDAYYAPPSAQSKEGHVLPQN